MTTFTVRGLPAPQGSKRAYVCGGRAVLVEASDKVKPWRANVTAAVRLPMGWPLEGPKHVTLTFYLPRPKAHYRAGGFIRDTAPSHVATKPDLDKLCRSTLDGLTDAGAWRDDSQVVQLVTEKRYVTDEHPVPCAVITIKEVSVRELERRVMDAAYALGRARISYFKGGEPELFDRAENALWHELEHLWETR